MITAEEFGHRLHMARIIRGIDQKELAQMCRVSRNAVRYWEEGQRLPYMDTLDALADALNVDLDYLFGRQEMLVRAESIEAEGAIHE